MKIAHCWRCLAVGAAPSNEAAMTTVMIMTSGVEIILRLYAPQREVFFIYSPSVNDMVRTYNTAFVRKYREQYINSI